MKHLVLGILLSLLAVTVLAPVSARASEPDVLFEETFRPTVTLRLQKLPRETGWRVRVLDGNAKREVASATFPEWAGSNFYVYQSRSVTLDGVRILLFEALPSVERGAPGSATGFQAAFAQRSSGNRGWTLIAQTRSSILEGGQRLELLTVNGKLNLVKRGADSATFCAGEGISTGFQRFIPKRLVFSSAVDIAPLTKDAVQLTAELPESPFQPEPYNYALWYAASSDFRNPDDSLTIIRPNELGDMDARTTWVSGQTGENRGQFVTSRLNPALKLKGFRIFPGAASSLADFREYARPKQILVSLENTRFIVDLPNTPYEDMVRTGGLSVQLPEPTRSRCMSIVVLDIYPAEVRSDVVRSSHVAITEITPFTELYGIPPDIAALVVIEMLLKRNDPRNTGRLAQLTSPLGAEIADVLVDVVKPGNSEDAARVTPLLRHLSAEKSVPILVDLFRTLDPDNPAYLQVKRSLVAQGEGARNFLSAIPEDELKGRKKVDLVRMIGRVGTEHDLLLFVAKLGQDDGILGRERIRAVVRGGDLVLQDLLQLMEMSDSARAQEDALQAVFSITRKLYYNAPTHVPGSSVVAVIARDHALSRMRLLALETLGYLAAPEAIDVLTSALEDARRPLERRAAAKALGRYPLRDIRLALEQALNDPSPDVRIEAMISLGNRDDVALSLAAIQAYSERESWTVGKQAAYNTLAIHGADNTRQFLEVHMLRLPESRDATLIADGFRRANRAVSLSVGLQLLDNPEVPFLTKRHILDSMGAVATAPYFDTLTRRLRDLSLFPELDEKRQQTLRERTFLALGRHRTPAAETFLLGELSTPSHQRIVLRALAFFKDPALIPVLRTFQTENPALESEITDTITMIERRQTVEEIQVGIEDVKDVLED